MSWLTHLEFAFSGERLPADRPQNNDGADGDILECRYDLEGIRASVDRDAIAAGAGSLWRYAPLLPVGEPGRAVTLGEGWTPLAQAPGLAARLGLRHLHVKNEGCNPTGTFKDRGAAVALTRCRELGIDTVVHNSSGNAAAAWALYAARAGVACVNVIPPDTQESCLVPCVLSGARTIVFDGPWHEAGRAVRDAVERHGWFNVMTLREPYRMEGKKTMGLEIAEQLGWRLPDVVVYPVGGGLGALAIFKAFEELRALGWVGGAARPRLVVAQYEGCAPIEKAWREGRPRAEPWTRLDVLPGGLKSGVPPGDRALLAMLRADGGAAYAVSSGDALACAAEMTALEGIFPAPESAITVAALRAAIGDGVVRRDDTVVIVATGAGVKSIPNFHPPAPERMRAGEAIAAAPGG